MPLNAGDAAGYGSVSGPSFPATGGEAASETAPLLIPETEPEPAEQWQPLSKEQLEMAAGGPWWRRVRCYLVLLFWLAWVAMLAVAVAIIVMSPRPVVTPLKWWQKTVFYELQPATFMEARKGGAEGINALCEQLPVYSSLGIGALILQGLFSKGASASNLTTAGRGSDTWPQIQHLLVESNKAGLKVVLDLCGLDPDDAKMQPLNATSGDQKSLRFWLEQGVAGFVICDTDAAYSEKVLLEWRGAFDEFSKEEEERILVVKQTQRILPPLDAVGRANQTLVDVVVKSILPSSHHLLSAQEVAVAIETHLQPRDEKTWPSWTVGGESPRYLKKLLLLLTMTLPGTPALQYDELLDQTQGTDKERRSAVSFFTSLSRSRAREEALMYGSFTFLPFNTTNTNSSSSSSNSTLVPSSSPPTILAFLRSWGCVHFLVLLNIGPELHPLDPAWAQRLPEAGVFVTSTGLDRLGSTTLYSLVLQPHEAIVIKLFEPGSYS